MKNVNGTKFDVCLYSLLALVLLGGHRSTYGQDTSSSVQPAAMLPDSPGTILVASTPETDAPAASGGTSVAPRYHRIIQPGQTAEPLTAGDKLALSIHNEIGLGSLAGSLLSAGWGQLNDGRPHYGTDSGAFGERLGASALTGATRSVFSYGIYASLFHQDPRYYVLGNSHTFKHRALYSASRAVMVGAPGQHSTVNWSNIAGTASSAALANVYYPPVDRVASKTVTSFANSLATQAATNELHEFIGDMIRKVRHKK